MTSPRPSGLALLVAALTTFTGTSSAQAPNDRPAKLTPPGSVNRDEFPNCRYPEYPARSARNNEQGTTQVQFLISETGQLINAEVIKSSGYRDLDRAVISALSTCPMLPAIVDGRPSEGKTIINYVWRLK
jgi:protein TonB